MDAGATDREEKEHVRAMRWLPVQQREEERVSASGVVAAGAQGGPDPAARGARKLIPSANIRLGNRGRPCINAFTQIARSLVCQRGGGALPGEGTALLSGVVSALL